jgi:hypothetical protein
VCFDPSVALMQAVPAFFTGNRQHQCSTSSQRNNKITCGCSHVSPTCHTIMSLTSTKIAAHLNSAELNARTVGPVDEHCLTRLVLLAPRRLRIRS